MDSNPVIKLVEMCKSIKQETPDKFLSRLLDLCNSYELYFNYDKDCDNTIKRLIFRIKKNNKTHPLLYYYCNGLVIDAINWSVLSSPPIAFNKKYFAGDISNNLDQYEIIKVIDGTVVTIYYWNDVWNISSSNGYDVSRYYWMGEMTYSEIIYDLISRLYPEVIENLGISLINNTRLDFKNLDKTYCYTIGFRHHNFHPLKNDPEKIWNIQKTKLSTLDVIYNEAIDGLQKQSILTHNITLDEINNINKMSISLSMKPVDYTFNYGFILRSNNVSVTKTLSSILLDSPLLKKIKRTIYEYPSESVKQYITNDNRFDYIAIKNYFNKVDRTDILQLYPQLTDKYSMFAKCIKETIDCIIAILKNKITKDKIILPFSTEIVTLSYALIKHISKYDAIDPNHKDTESVLKDYIMNSDYAVLILNTINKYK